MKAIVTTFFGPTNTKGARIQCKAESMPTRYYDYDHAASNAHQVAAQAYRDEMGWRGKGGRMVGGGLPDGTGYAWVFTETFPDQVIPANA